MFTRLSGRDETYAIGELRKAEKFVACELNRSNFVLPAFIDNKADHHRAGIGINKLDVFNLKINVATIEVEFMKLFLIVLELFIFQITTAGDPREHPMSTRLDHFSQFALGKGISPDKLNLDNLYLRTFSDFERSRGTAAFFDYIGNGFDLSSRVTRFLIHLLNFLAIGKKFPFIERFADF